MLWALFCVRFVILEDLNFMMRENHFDCISTARESCGATERQGCPWLVGSAGVLGKAALLRRPVCQGRVFVE